MHIHIILFLPAFLKFPQKLGRLAANELCPLARRALTFSLDEKVSKKSRKA